ncbi:MAG TPA: twin-arginine translocase subunit TatC [candidate division Zixibacteria bacterium]|nr:twin-arginine translocase subunit TatC [candidate division Zixibacteria bacterium]
MTDDEATMTLMEHLEELRRRLIIIVISILGAAVLGFVVSRPVLILLRSQLPDEYEQLQFLGPADAFAAQLKVAGFLGIALAMPVILYQAWRFIGPGLTPRERRFVWPITLAALLLFVLGVAIGYVIIPYALSFLLNFGEDLAQPNMTIDRYVGFVTTMLLAFGLALEFPVVLIGLSKVRILNYRRLASQRRWAILVIVLFAILLTPGGDPVSSLILSGVMFLLFEGSLQVIRLMHR